jgi:hypothetical protein
MRTWASWILLYFFWSGKHKIQYPKPSIAESLQVQQILLPSLHHVDIDYSDYTRTTQGQPGTAWDNLSSKAWPPPCPLRAWAIEACDCFLWNLAINRSQSISITLVNSCWTHVELILKSCYKVHCHAFYTTVFQLLSCFLLNFPVTSSLISSWKELEQLISWSKCTTLTPLVSEAFNLDSVRVYLSCCRLGQAARFFTIAFLQRAKRVW